MAVKVKRVVDHVRVCITATFNNTIVVVTDAKGNKLTGESAGTCKYQSSKKSTPYAAQQIAAKACQAAKDMFKVETAEVRISAGGPRLRRLLQYPLSRTGLRDRNRPR